MFNISPYASDSKGETILWTLIVNVGDNTLYLRLNKHQLKRLVDECAEAYSKTIR